MAFFPISPIPQSGGNFLSSMQAYMFGWCALTPTKIMIAYCQDNPIKLYVQIVNFNGINAPTMGPATYVGDIILGTGAVTNNLVKLDAFDSTTVGLMWVPNLTGTYTTNHYVSVLNVDVNDNITWNLPTIVQSSSGGHSNGATMLKCVNSSTALTSSWQYSHGAYDIKKLLRTGNTIALGTTGAFAATSSQGALCPKKLPTSGIAYTMSNADGTNPAIYFTNASGTVTPITGISGSTASGLYTICPMTDNLVHYFRTFGAGVIAGRPLNINLGAGTGNWMTPLEVNTNVTGWLAGSMIDAIAIDSEYFMIMSSTTAFTTQPSGFGTVQFSFIIGRYNPGTQTYVFAPAKYTAPTNGIPIYGMRNFHLINTNTIACFCIQGTPTTRVLGVKFLYL